MLEGNEDLIGQISPSGNIVGAMIAQKGEKGNTGQAFTYDMFTEEQLKALTGPKGEKGDPGEKGNTGQAFTYDMFTEEQLKALTGPKGDPGIQGPKGDNGITPTIGDNGNWYLGSDDTGKPSRGIQGEQGPKGEQGEKGKDAPNMYKYKKILTADVAKRWNNNNTVLLQGAEPIRWMSSTWERNCY